LEVGLKLGDGFFFGEGDVWLRRGRDGGREEER
jgi:hypothetical protein